MIVRFNKSHEREFLELVESMWRDKQTYLEVSYEYLDRYWYEARFYDSDFVFFVSEDKYGKVNGFILGEIFREVIEIVFLFVRPQDRRKNIGSVLKRQVIRYAQALGKKEVTAYNLHSNERSLGMNVKIGRSYAEQDAGVEHFIENIDEYYYKSVYVLDRQEEDNDKESLPIH